MGGTEDGGIELVHLFESGRMEVESIIFSLSTVGTNGGCRKVNNQEVAIKEKLY